MNRVWMSLAGLLAWSAATAAELADFSGASARSGLYVHFNFGGSATPGLHYGLRLSPGHSPLPAALPVPQLKLDFSTYGSVRALLGNLPLLSRTTLVTGSGEGTEEISPPPAATEVSWYDPTSWGITQWGAVAGTGILAYAFAADRQQDDSPPPISRTSATANAPVDPCAPEGTPEISGECLSDAGFSGSQHGRLSGLQREDASWLDEGTGQMGDLLPQ